MTDEIKRKIYERYKMYWMFEHEISIEEISKQAQIWASDCDTKETSFEEYLKENGLGEGVKTKGGIKNAKLVCYRH
jgi:hypothetical protein